MEFKDDLYSILNVPEYSTIGVVKQAYHVLAKKYHPDVSNHTGKMFAQITDAYKILSNPQSKKAYDEYLKAKHDTEQLKTTQQNSDIDKEVKETLKTKTNNFNKSAASSLYENEEDLVDEEATSTKYYINPKNEPIFTVIRHFNHYRFENAVAAIWNRSFFAILGATFIYAILTPISIFFKICNCAVNKHHYKYHWLATLNTSLQNPKIIKPTMWTCILSITLILKLITNTCKTLYWIFKRIIIPFLIPNAIRSLKR